VTDALRGRLMSLFGLIVMGFAPVGSMLYGVAAHYTGPGPAITGGSLLAAACAGAVLLRHPELRHFTFTELEPAESAPFPPPSAPLT